MSKHDLRARPVFHHTRDAIEAYLTVVMTALAVARYLQEATGIQHRQDRARATPPAGGHHQPQRPPNHCSAPAHPDRSRNPHIPQALRTLRRQESGLHPGRHRDQHRQDRRELRSLQEVTINLNGHHLAAAPRLTDTANDILTALSTPPPAH